MDAFQATLEELSYADLLIHVIDASDPEQEAHIAVVEQLVEQLAKPGVPVIQCFNKADLVMAEDLPVGKLSGSLCQEGSGLKPCSAWWQTTPKPRASTGVFSSFPMPRGGILDRLHQDAQVLAVEYALEESR